jgi:hypothetical protein
VVASESGVVDHVGQREGVDGNHSRRVDGEAADRAAAGRTADTPPVLPSPQIARRKDGLFVHSRRILILLPGRREEGSEHARIHVDNVRTSAGHVEEWPARIACPKCHELSVVTRDTCEHCGALHAAPPPDATEIFESTAAAPQVALTAS